MLSKTTHYSQRQLQELLFHNPTHHLSADYSSIYNQGLLQLGWPKSEKKIYHELSRANTIAIAGAALGDEGKGRIVDNKIEELLKKKPLKKIAVIRFQGGNNAGHTIEKDKIKLALHLVPSGVLYEQSVCIMDSGMVVHPEDMHTEVTYIEKVTGSLKNRLFLSTDAILNTDLERAEEVLNRVITGKAKGGTGRGISPSYAHHIDRLGLTIQDLLSDDWKDVLHAQYKRYEKLFSTFGMQLATDIEVPDFSQAIHKSGSNTRRVGNFKTFLSRIEESRTWIIARKLAINTFPLHKSLFADASVGIVFEGAQAAGLDVWTGTRPDTTSSNTRIDGVKDGTGFWRTQDIEERIGVFKIPYTSSVGERRMPTHIDLPKTGQLPKNTTAEQQWGYWVREEAHEYGTTTGRPRDITHLDLEFLRYNARMSDCEMLAGTHLDTAKEGQEIKVCTHYTNTKGDILSYQPGLHHIENVVPHYVTLPGWDGIACRKAERMKDLPENALKFLSYIQARTGYPITLVTTGAKRDNIVTF